MLSREEVLQIEFLRINQAKKEILKREHKKKMEALRLDEVGSSQSQWVANLPGEVEMKVQQPVKIEKLPQFLKSSKLNLESPFTSTRDNDYVRLIKAVQNLKKKQNQ